MKAIVAVFAIFAVYLYAASGIRVACPVDWTGIKDDHVLVPHPCNCNAYFVCQGEVILPMPCPPHLHFNNAKKRCDYTNIANCRTNPDCP